MDIPHPPLSPVSVSAPGALGRQTAPPTSGEKGGNGSMFPEISISISSPRPRDLSSTAPLSTKNRKEPLHTPTSLNFLIGGNLRLLRELSNTRKRKKNLAPQANKEGSWVYQVEERKKKLMQQGRRLIENHVDYRFHSEIAGQLVQDRMITESKKQRQSRTNRPSGLKKFTLGKGFTTLGSQSSIMGSLKPLFHTLDVIDLSNQCIGQRGCRQLSEFIKLRDCHVVMLKMQRSQLTDACLATLCRGLQFNESITMLDLAHNSMAHAAFTALGEVLTFNSALKELRLSWNNCHGKGLRFLSKGLLTNRSVKRLDLSWNLLSRERNNVVEMVDDDTEAGIAVFASMLRKNKSLRHLDISNCCLVARHAAVVAEAFNNNHSITGFHYEGNTGLLDPKGFIHVHMDQQGVMSSASKLGNDPMKAASMFNTCWECKCWREASFTFTTAGWSQYHSTDKPQHLFLHLSIDQWKADLMATTPEGDFITHRMLPPGRTWFFFSEGSRVLLSHDLPVATHPRLHLQRNYVDAERVAGFDGYRRIKFRDTPCVEPPEKMGLALVHPEWDPLRSAFAYRVKVQHGLFDSGEVVTRAIRQDVEYTKLIKMKVVDEEEVVRMCEELAPVYGIIARMYQMYSAGDPEGDPFELCWEDFLQFCLDHNIVDDRCTVKKINQIFLVTNVELESTAGNDADSLTRFEFFEMLVRVCLFKYEADKMKPGPAVARLFHECIRERVTDLALLDNDYFRYTCLYTQPVGRVLNQFQDKLRRVFLDYSSGVANIKVRSEHKPQMKMDDFIIYLYECKVLRANYLEEFGILDARKVFFRSKLLVEDEQATNLHTALSFPDFLEALTRLLCIPPIVTLVVVKRRLIEGGTFDSLLKHFLEMLLDNVYFIDLATNKLLRKFPSCRILSASEQERITFDYIRGLLRVRRGQAGPSLT